MASEALSSGRTAVVAVASGGPLRRRSARAVAPTLTAVALLIGWQLAGRFELFAPRQYLPPAADVLAGLADLMMGAPLWLALWNTLTGVMSGLAIAVVIGLAAGVLVGSSAWLNRATRIPVEFLRPVPSVALIPLAILIYGNGFESKVFLVVYAALWPILVQTIYGIRDIDPVAMDTARSFSLGPVRRLVDVAVPCALPHAVTGIRIASSIAIMLAVTAELIIGMPGLGKEISLARQVGDVTGMYAFIIVTGLLGWGLNASLLAVERRVLFWHQSYRP